MTTALDRVRELFPQCSFSEDEINWRGGASAPGSDAPYVDGYRHCLVLDGEFKTEEILALADWMRTGDEQKSEKTPPKQSVND